MNPRFLVLCLALACSESKTSGIPPRLGVSAASLAFGKVRPGATKKLPLQLQSTSSVALNILSVTIEGDLSKAFSAGPMPGELTPSATAPLEVTFAPATLGDLKATLVIASTDPDSPARIALSGRGSNPKLTLAPGCSAPCTGFTASASPASLDFGAQRPLRHDASGKVIDEPAWPVVTLLNSGELPVTVHTITLEGDPAFTAVEAIAATDFPIGAGAGQAFHLRFDPVASRSNYSGKLTVTSDDPAQPSLSVALSGKLLASQPPLVCAAIVETQGPDGSLSAPKDAAGKDDFAGAPPPAQPGKNARVTFSAFSDHFLPAPDTTRCTTSPQTGRAGLALKWTIEERPTPSVAKLAGDTSAEPTFTPDAIGHYRVRLTATDPDGVSASADVPFDAFPRRDLVAQLTWAEAGIDLDLHLVRPDADCAGGSCVFDPAGDLNGFSARNGASFDWGKPGPGDDPRLDRDDQGTQGNIESVSLDHPEDDPACAGGSCTYGLYVHYFADHRADSGTKPSCPSTPCAEGDLCGCAAETSCVALHCLAPVHPRVAVYVKPTAGAQPVLVPVPTEAFSIAGPCFLWHLADVVWKLDGTAQVVPTGTGKGELLYYGQMEPGSFACSPNTDPGLPKGYLKASAPLYP